MANGVKIDREHLKPIPVGDSDWADFSQKSYTVDKTLLIKEILDDNTKVALFTRPRRFGKNYAAEMTVEGVTDILKLGLAYYKKCVHIDAIETIAPTGFATASLQ